MSAAALVGAVYGVLVCQIPRLRDMLLVLGGAAVLLAAFAFGVAGTTTGVLRWTRVRTRATAYVIAVCAALVAWWGACVAWEYVVLRRLGYSPPLVKLMLPPITWDVARMLNEVGTLSYRNKPLRGNVLWILWGVEAAAVLVVGIRFPPRWLSKQAVCEYCGGWCRYKEGFLSIDYGDEDLLRAALENKDLGALEELGPADMDAGRRFRLDLQSCPGCEHAHLLSAFRIDVFEKPQDGRRRQTATLIVDRLW